MSPKISVIIPAYNVGRYISDCLEPILKFNEIPIEIIVVNDGSIDETADILSRYSDERLKVINHEANKGLPAARNTGFKASTGEYVLPLDSDDIPVPGNWINLFNSIQGQNDAVLAYGTAQLFQDGNKFEPNYKINLYGPSGDVFSKIIVRNDFISVGSALIRRTSIDKSGPWNESLTIGEDLEMWCRLAMEGKFIFVPALVMGYRQRASSMTNSRKYLDEKKFIMPVQLAFEHLLEKGIPTPAYKKLKKTAYSNFHYRFGMKCFKFGSYSQAIIHLIKSFFLRPSMIFYLISYPYRISKRKYIHRY